MYDLVLFVPPSQKAPIYATDTANSGTLTYGSATYVLKDNSGVTLASGTVDGHDAPDSLTVRTWKVLDAASIPLPVGCSTLEFVNVDTASDGIGRNEHHRVVLFVPGQTTHPLYPTAADVQVELVARGVMPASTTAQGTFLDIYTAALKGRQQFEAATGHTFLATAQTRFYDYPCGTRRLLLRAELVGMPTVAINGTAKVLNTDYFLKPDNADRDGKPWNAIEFANYALPGGNLARAVTVTGTFGYGTTIPADVWSAMRDVGCLECIPAIQAALSGGLVSWKIGDDSETYGANPFRASVDAWNGRIQSAVSGYRNVTAYMAG